MTVTTGRFVPKLIKKNAFGVFELRHYRAVAEHFPQYLKLGAEKHHYRVRHGPLCGYWTPEIGGQNEVIHMWHFESTAQRRAVRKLTAEDEQWQGEYIKPTRHMVAEQTNSLLLPIDRPMAPGRSSTDGTTFYYVMRHEPVAEDGSVLDVPTAAGVERCGEWLTAVTNGPTCKVTLLRGTDLDRLHECIAAAPADGAIDRLLYVTEHAKRNNAWWQ